MTLHERLKQDTAQTHASLEEAVTQHGFFDSLPAYVSYLQRFGQFQAEVEHTLQSCGADDVIPDWPHRRRAHWIGEDLRALGHQAQLLSFESATGDECRPERVLGMAYVIEGATLGGAVVLKRLAKLGVTAERGGSFLASYGAARGKMWQSFLTTLKHWERRGVMHEGAVESALATFRLARSYLITEPAIARR